LEDFLNLSDETLRDNGQLMPWLFLANAETITATNHHPTVKSNLMLVVDKLLVYYGLSLDPIGSTPADGEGWRW